MTLTVLWGWGGYGKGEGTPLPPHYICHLQYPLFLSPTPIKTLVPIKHWGKLVFLQNKGYGGTGVPVWNLGFPTPIFKVRGYGRARIQSGTIPTPLPPVCDVGP